MSAKTIFHEALELKPPIEREAFLDAQCGNDADLRREVEDLLRHEGGMGTFLESPPTGLAKALTLVSPAAEKIGSQLGPYKLLAQLGEGGMGVVYLAEQEQPVRRQVALKLIKPGLDTRQVIARFEAERQALALMDHVNIARVLDAGATASGRPYFVMELVHGVPITKYCDDHRLTPRQRLELFVPVCQAIQHAHQKGIIHRDIKPSNVMVTLHDGQPVPKVIDFGVAKATEQKLTDHSLCTQHGTLVGTLEYMSPEQAEVSALGVDTRIDIYSLGVLLYELLTGSTPFTHRELAAAGMLEMLRVIREQEPPKPSARLSSLGGSQASNAAADGTRSATATLASISAQRNTEPARLTKLMRGELDWIVMKTLEKDRNRRYETANGLAADVLRYLNDEQVQACPPSARYRFGKFARKNRATLTTAAIVALTLVIGAGLSIWQAVRATNAETEARENETQARTAEEAERDARQQETIQRQQAETNFQVALGAIDRMLANVSAPELNDIPRVGPLRRQILKDAITFYGRIRPGSGASPESRFRAARTWNQMADLSKNLDEDGQTHETFTTAIVMLGQLAAEEPQQNKYRAMLGEFEKDASQFYLHSMHDYQEAERHSRRSAELYAELANQEPTERKFWRARQASSLNVQSMALVLLGKSDEALTCATRALELLDPSQPTSESGLNGVLFQIAMLKQTVSPDESDDLFRRALAETRDHISARGNEGRVNGRYEVRVQYSSEGDRRGFANNLRYVASIFSERHPDEAERLFDESVAVWRKICTPSHHRRRDFSDFEGSLLLQARHLRLRAGTKEARADSEQSAAQLKKAESLFQEAIKTQRHLIAKFAMAEDRWGLLELYREELHHLLENLDGASADEAATRKLQAATLRTEAIQFCRELVAEFPESSNYRERLALLLQQQLQQLLAELNGTSGDDAAARKLQAALRAEAISLSRQLAVEFPDKAHYRHRLAELLRDQATYLWQGATTSEPEKAAKQMGEVEDLLGEAIPLARRNLTDNPTDPGLSDRVATVLHERARYLTAQAEIDVNRGAATVAARHYQEALPLLYEAIEIEARVASAVPENQWYRNRLAYLCDLAARITLSLSELPDSNNDSESKAARLAKADVLFLECINSRRQLAAEFPKHEFDFRDKQVQVLCDHALRLRQRSKEQAAKGEQDLATTTGAQAEVLLSEAIEVCRQLVAESPDKAANTARLDATLKIQTQHFGPPKEAGQ